MSCDIDVSRGSPRTFLYYQGQKCPVIFDDFLVSPRTFFGSFSGYKLWLQKHPKMIIQYVCNISDWVNFLVGPVADSSSSSTIKTTSTIKKNSKNLCLKIYSNFLTNIIHCKE